MLCYRLQPIRAKRGDFYPLPHPKPPRHAVCGEPLVDVGPSGDEVLHCPKCCELSYPEDVDRPRGLCEGHEHAIR